MTPATTTSSLRTFRVDFMYFVLRWKRRFLQTGWSVGLCSKCKQAGPTRVDNVVEVLSFGLLPITKSLVGRIRRCDFCERAIEMGGTPPSIALDEWSHADVTRWIFRNSVSWLRIMPHASAEP
jgi:hypothetical protein